MASTLHDGDESPSWNSKQEWKQIETPLLTSQLALISHSWSHFKPRSNATESASLTSPQIPEAQFSFSNISMSLPESSLWISIFPNKLPEDSESEHPKSQPTTSNFWPPFANLFKFPYIMSQTQGPKHQSQRDKDTGTRRWRWTTTAISRLCARIPDTYLLHVHIHVNLPTPRSQLAVTVCTGSKTSFSPAQGMEKPFWNAERVNENSKYVRYQHLYLSWA